MIISINDYWTKVNETDEVEGRLAADVEYFNQIFKLNFHLK